MNDLLQNIFLIYLLAINLAGFFTMFADKRRARKNKWRIKERTLFLLALAGGCPGCLAGMYVCVPAQNETLVLCPGDAGYSGTSDCTGCLAQFPVLMH